jgi:NADPH:quinone reductase-like Zn-dependent oxidoreductase
MRAFIVPEFGQPGAVGERPAPEAGDGQILVRVKVAGVNAMDPFVRAGFMKDFMEHRLPLTLGRDYAGTVAAVGPGVTAFAIGDEVFGSVNKPYQGEGSFAEFVTAGASDAALRPDALSPEQAATLPVAGGTALAALDALGLDKGETVAIIGAGGGAGSFATRLAAERGLHVIAVTKGENADYVRGLGADEVVDYQAGDVAEQLLAAHPDGVAGVIDLFHDAQGAAELAAAVRPGGRIAGAAAMGIEQVLADGPVTGIGIAAAVDRAAELGQLAAVGRLEVATEVLPLDRAAEALDRQMTKQVRGKQVLRIAEEA